MSAFFDIAGNLIDSEELAEQAAMGRWNDFEKAVEDGRDTQVRVGEQEFSSAKVASATRGAGAPDFTPIGIGKPLSVEILTVYTGDKSRSRKADMLVASGVKSIETFDAAPRAVNQLVDGVGSNTTLVSSAFTVGTPIVYYSPGVVNNTTLVAFELVADQFDDDVFSGLQGLFDAAAGIPIFAPAKSVLVAGSILVKTIANLGKAIFETDAFLSADVPLRFGTPGFPVALARHAVLFNDRDRDELVGHEVRVIQELSGDGRAALVNRQTGTEYRGRAPYIIANFDGAKRPELDKFAPTLASAALLERFYRADDVGGRAMGALQEGMGLYSDLTFRRRAERLIKDLDPDSDSYEKMYGLLKAFNGNIQNELLKLELPAKAGA